MKIFNVLKVNMLFLLLFAGGFIFFAKTNTAEAGNCVPICEDDIPGYEAVTGVSKQVTYDGTTYYVKNETDETVWVAINYFIPGDPSSSCLGPSTQCARYDRWEHRGWWKIYPGQTKALVSDYTNRYIYIYAESANGRNWSGSLYKYVTNKSFRNSTASSSGAYRAGFIEIDLGNNNHTVTTRLID